MSVVGQTTQTHTHHQPRGRFQSERERAYELNKRPLIEQLNRICCEIHSSTLTPLVSQSIMAACVCVYCVSKTTSELRLHATNFNCNIIRLCCCWWNLHTIKLCPSVCTGSELITKRFSMNWFHCHLFRYLNLYGHNIFSLFDVFSVLCIRWRTPVSLCIVARQKTLPPTILRQHKCQRETAKNI